MTLLVTWLAFPLVLVALSLGCGLLTERLAGVRLPGALLPATGLALMIVVAQFPTLWEATAQATTPIVVVLALAGFTLSPRLRERRVQWWAVAAAVAAFCVYAAPVVISGQATWAGFLKLDDSSAWMAIVDRVMSHGLNLAGLPPSGYRAVLHFYLGSGYPIGAFLPLGIGRGLVGWDVAWLFQPYLAFLGALVALGAWAVTEPLVRSPRLRALAAFLGAQSALLFGYYLWGGIKEVAAAAFVVTVAGLAAFAIRESRSARPLVPLAVVSAALIGVLGGGGAVWLAPMLLAAVVATWLLAGRVQALVRAAGFAILTGLLWIPVIASGALSPVAESTGTAAAVVEPLSGFPLSGFQLFGIWPAGDFRLDPNDPAIAYALVAVAAVAALIAIRFALRARSWGLLIYVGTALVSALIAFVFAPPWIAGKALATVSPAIPLAAAAGGAAVFAAGLRVAGAILLVALAAGILWSNALAYHDVNLAPRGELAELQTIGGVIAGEGPTLMTEYNPYGFRHFLRDAAPEGVPGGDTDAFNVSALLRYRTLVLRRSPAQSRPPSPYRLIWTGNYYEVWQRSEGSRGAVEAHLGLGSAVDPAGVPNCSEVRRLAQKAGPSGRLAAVAREPVEVVPLLLTAHPAAWQATGDLELVPKGAGTVTAQVHLPRGATYEVWLGGSAGARPSTAVSIDGRGVSSMGQLIQSDGDYVLLASARLGAGEHTISLDLHGSNLGPGSGAPRAAIGPLTLSAQDSADTKISWFPPGQASRLCGRRWDWVEALRK